MSDRSYAIERNFGLVVGAAFAAFGGWWLWRGKFLQVAPYVLALGLLLVLLGLIWPRALVVPNRLWMGLAAGMSFVMTRVILTAVFFLLVTPIGLLRRMFGGDPLQRRGAPSESYWRPYQSRQSDPRHFEKMY
jgi:hypothetical protein